MKIRKTNKNKPNIEFFIDLTQAFLEGKIADYNYKIDFLHELNKSRYNKMINEDPHIAEMIYTTLYEDAFDSYYDASDEVFYKAIKQAYEKLVEVYNNGFDIF